MPVVQVVVCQDEVLVSEFAVILAAAGQSSRFGDPFQKKVFTTVGGKLVDALR
ncbi:MAG: hypothetical protein U0930_25975 [Pirellulales bacterium]